MKENKITLKETFKLNYKGFKIINKYPSRCCQLRSALRGYLPFRTYYQRACRRQKPGKAYFTYSNHSNYHFSISYTSRHTFKVEQFKEKHLLLFIFKNIFRQNVLYGL